MSCRGERGVGGYLQRMRKDGEESSSFFVVLFGILRFFDILREYRAAAGVDDRPSPQSLFRVGFEMKESEEKFGKSDFYSYICINKNGSTYD